MQKELTIKKEISAPVQKANELEIQSNDDLVGATELISTVNKYADSVKEEKEKVTKPLNEALKAERNRWKPIELELTNALSTIRSKMSDFQTAQVKKEEEEKNKIASDGRLKMETAIERMDEVEVAEVRVDTGAGSVTFQTDYEITVTDIEKVPFKFLKAEIKKNDIKSAYKLTGEQIPGLIIKEVQVVRNKR